MSKLKKNAVALSGIMLTGAVAGTIATINENQIRAETASLALRMSYAKSKIISSIEKGSVSVDLKAYLLSSDQVQSIVRDICCEYPDFFYLSPNCTCYENSYVNKIDLCYYYSDNSQRQAMINDYTLAKQKYLQTVSDDMSDYDKVLNITNSIIQTNEYGYDLSIGELSNTSYGCLVKNKTYCFGYSLALKALLTDAGVPCEIVLNNNASHAWVRVEIDSAWYNIDLTLNDPVGFSFGDYIYPAFLVSDNQYSQLNPSQVWDEKNTICTSEKYNSLRFKSDGIGRVCYAYSQKDKKGYWYYLNTGLKIVKMDFSNNTEKIIGNTLSLNSVSTLTSANNMLYYHNDNQIYSFDPETKTSKLVYTLTNTEKTFGTIQKLDTDIDQNVYYKVYDSNTKNNALIKKLNIGISTPDTQLRGEGTEENPYKISTVNDILLLKKNVNVDNNSYEGKYFELTNDLNMSGVEWDGIGCYNISDATQNKFFKGNFNGNGHQISNISGESGLFAAISDCEIHNIGVINFNINANNNPSGAIAAVADTCAFSDVYVSGYLSSTSTNLSSAFVGSATSCDFKSCFALNDCAENNSFGGTFIDCSATNCYGYSKSDKIIEAGITCPVNKCKYSQVISGEISWLLNKNSLSDWKYDGINNIPSLNGNRNAVRLTLSYGSSIDYLYGIEGMLITFPSMPDEKLYSWEKSDGSSLEPGEIYIDDDVLTGEEIVKISGEGTEINPYTIDSLQSYKEMCRIVNSGDSTGLYFSLSSDLNVDEDLFASIGTSEHPFNGTFIGNGFSITYIINSSDSSNTDSLFNFIDVDGVIDNLTINPYIYKTGINSTTAGVCYQNKGIISNCNITSDGYLKGGNSAGICYNNVGTIEKCSNTCDLILNSGSGASCGGIAAVNSGNIIDCLNRGSINANNLSSGVVGGIAGNNLASLSGCVNIADISSKANIKTGSLIGEMGFDEDEINVSNCAYLSSSFNWVGEDSENFTNKYDNIFDFSEEEESSGKIAYEMNKTLASPCWSSMGSRLFISKNGINVTTVKSEFLQVNPDDNSDKFIETFYTVSGGATPKGTIVLPVNSVFSDYNLVKWVSPAKSVSITPNDVLKQIDAPTSDTTFTAQYAPVEKIDISDLLSGFNIPDYQYTKSEIKPSFVLRNELGCLLKEDIDYEINYSNNILPGTAKITITGIGDYKGSVSTNFNITKIPYTDLGEITASDITYGQPLSASAITSHIPLEMGTVAFKKPDLRPLTSSGTQSFDIIITPTTDALQTYDFSSLSGWNETTKTINRVVPVKVQKRDVTVEIKDIDFQINDNFDIFMSCSSSLTGVVDSSDVINPANASVINANGPGEYPIFVIPPQLNHSENYNIILPSDLTLVVPDIESVSVKTPPIKTKYLVGESLDLTGLSLNVRFIGGKTQVIDQFDSNFAEFDKAGNFSISVNFAGKTVSVPVQVGDIEVTNVSFSLNTVQTEYYEGHTFNPTGITAIASYNDGSKKDVSSLLSVSNINPLKLSDASVDVSFDSFKKTVPINVKKNNINGLTISSLPNKTLYFPGETISLDGMKLKATYEDGSSKTITPPDIECSTIKAPDNNSSVSVFYDGLSQSFNISIMQKQVNDISIVSMPKLDYIHGDKFDFSDLVILVNYNDGSSEQISYNSNIEIRDAKGNLLTSSTICDIEIHDESALNVKYLGKSCTTDPINVSKSANTFDFVCKDIDYGNSPDIATLTPSPVPVTYIYSKDSLGTDICEDTLSLLPGKYYVSAITSDTDCYIGKTVVKSFNVNKITPNISLTCPSSAKSGNTINIPATIPPNMDESELTFGLSESFESSFENGVFTVSVPDNYSGDLVVLINSNETDIYKNLTREYTISVSGKETTSIQSNVPDEIVYGQSSNIYFNEKNNIPGHFEISYSGSTFNDSSISLSAINMTPMELQVKFVPDDSEIYSESIQNYYIPVKKANVEFKSKSYSMAADDPVINYDYTVSGLVNGDSVVAAPVLKSVEAYTPGKYDISISEAEITSPECYNIIYTSGTLEITPKKKINVVFMNNIGIENYQSQIVDRGGYISVPSPVIPDGYTLDGWYTDDNYFNRFDFNLPVQDDMILYTKYDEISRDLIEGYPLLSQYLSDLIANGGRVSNKKYDFSTINDVPSEFFTRLKAIPSDMSIENEDITFNIKSANIPDTLPSMIKATISINDNTIPEGAKKSILKNSSYDMEVSFDDSEFLEMTDSFDLSLGNKYKFKKIQIYAFNPDTQLLEYVGEKKSSMGGVVNIKKVDDYTQYFISIEKSKETEEDDAEEIENTTPPVKIDYYGPTDISLGDGIKEIQQLISEKPVILLTVPAVVLFSILTLFFSCLKNRKLFKKNHD